MCIRDRCDLLAHVTTQLPYALLAMTASAVCGYLPVLWFGPSVWPISLGAGAVLMLATLLIIGRNACKPLPQPSKSRHTES